MRFKHETLALALAGIMGGVLVAAEPAPPASTNSTQELDWFGKIQARYTKPVKKPQDAPPLPPVAVAPRWPAAEYGYKENRFGWHGWSLVRDPINKEALFLCGHNGGMTNGTMGSWALAEDGKTWRELKFASAVLDSLREKCIASRQPAKDGEAAARNLFYAALDAVKEAAAVKGEPARLLAEAVRQVMKLDAALKTAKPEGAEKEAVAHALPLVAKAIEQLKTAQAGFNAGKLDAALLKNCFDGQWALDEAADCLASSPAPREKASVAYDPANQCVVLFGGSHHDYMTADTWIFDCTRKSWRQVWPRIAPSARMGAKFEWSADRKALVLSGGQTVLNKMVYQQGSMNAPDGEFTFDARTGEWSGENGVAAGTRIYRTIVPGYNPCWYDAAPRGDPQATADWLAKLQPNTWTKVPAQPSPAPERDWGSARLDPDRDQIYRWTGGHCADPSTIVSTYHPGINRWSIPFVGEIGQKGMTFNGRPDCMNHTYLHYAYDPLSKRLICPSMGGTGVYNPDTRDFEFSVDQPFNCQIYETCAAGTSKGVVLWGQGGQTWLFDYQARAWKPFPTSGERPRPACDGSAMCYDAKRDVLWIATFAGYQKPSGNIWRCDIKTGVFQAMNPANAETIGKARGFSSEIRESVYVPTADIVLYNQFVKGQEVAYDIEKNRWVVLVNVNPKLERQGGVSDTLNYDARRDLIWNLNSFKDIYVIRLDPKTLVMSDDPGR
jgi:hypothetical protein